MTLVIVAVLVIAVLFVRGKVHHRPELTKQQELSVLEKKIGKLMILPSNEQPTLATVTDKSKLSDKFLAAKSENGDKILIFAKNHTLIIYRPSINKIAAVGAVSVDPSLAQAQGSSITVLDSTNNPAKTQTVIKEVKKAFPDIKVTNGGKSNRQNFPYTIVIDNTNQKDSLRDSLMKDISGKRGFLPSSENAPSTEFLIIVGQD